MTSHFLLAAVLGFASAPAASPPAMPASGKPGSLSRMAAQVRLPLFSTEFSDVPIAEVGDAFITLGELEEGILSSHQGGGSGSDYREVLDRLIDLQLIVGEAREMGIAELDEVKQAFEEFKTKTRREVLREKMVEHVKSDPAEVERTYQDAVREWKIYSGFFAVEQDAKDFVAAVRAGQPFSELLAKRVEEKKATASTPGFVPRAQLAPQILATVGTLKTGAPSDPVKVKDGFAVVMYDEVRYPEVAEQRLAAETASVERLRTLELQRQFEVLKKKYAKVDKVLLKSLDYHSVKRFQAFAKDKRPVVRIAGEAPITVADLTSEINFDFFHGIETPIREKQLNAKKEPKLDVAIARRVQDKEAGVRNIEQSAEFRRAVKDYTNAVLFGMFVNRVILPELNVMESEVKAYYDAHADEFMRPQMYKLDGVGFATMSNAETALKRAQSGTDFEWVKSNSEGQLKPQDQALELEGKTVTASSLPIPLVQALAGARAGDLRLFAPEKGGAYLVRVLEVIEATPEPYVEAREVVAKRLGGEKLNAAVKEYAAKLREAQDVRVFITSVGDESSVTKRVDP